MAKDPIVGKTIRDVGGDLKQAITAEAENEEASMNDVVMRIVADRYGLRYTPVGRRSPGLTDATTLGLTMRRSLRRKLQTLAVRNDTTSTQLILDALSDHFRNGRK